MIPYDILFGLLALIIIGSAAGMLLSQSAVYSVLFLVLNFGAIAFIYLLLGAPFIAMAQVSVYAGAIMVLFLFVIMLLGAEKIGGKDPIRGQKSMAILLAIILLVEGFLAIVAWGGNLTAMEIPASGFASPTEIGLALFHKYMLPFEITSAILLVAVIGAIVLTKKQQKKIRVDEGRKKD